MKIISFLKKYWKPIIFSFSMIIFVIITRLLLKNQIDSFDKLIYKYVTYYKCDLLTFVMKVISFFCSTYFIILSTVLIMTFIKRKQVGFYIGLNVLLCFLLNQTFKLIFARPRPVGINLVVEHGYSFPSGHSMMSVSFYGLFVYLILHKKWKRKKKIILSTLLALLVLLVGISRIYLGVHHASDVVAGFALSLAYLVIYIKFFYKKISNK